MGLMNQTETWHHSITLLLLKGHFGQNSITPAQCIVIYYIICIFSSFSSKQNTQKGFQDSSNRFFDFNVSTREQICTCSYAIGKICCYRIYAILRPGRRIQENSANFQELLVSAPSWRHRSAILTHSPPWNQILFQLSSFKHSGEQSWDHSREHVGVLTRPLNMYDAIFIEVFVVEHYL